MNLKQKITSLLCALAALLSGGCGESSTVTEEHPESVVSGLVLRVGQSSQARTAMGDEDGTSQEIRWAVGDKLTVWAQSASTSEYVLDATPFTFATYNAEFHSADFLADVPAMAEDTYTYHALYPEAATRTGTQVSYTLPATQSGRYDPALDVMTATTTGNALLPRSGNQHVIPWEEPQLNFSHLFHLIRIRIPEGKNLLGLPLRRLEITFPQEVVGTVSFDALDPVNTQSWSNLSNKITVDIPQSVTVDAGEGYVWLHVKPGTLSGEISFQAYNDAGVPAALIATAVERELSAQHITPIALTIPESSLAPFTYVAINETGNNLGEDWQTMTLSGYNFLVPFSTTTVTTKQFTPNSSKRYLAVICADPSTMAGKSLPLQYESVHALFDDSLTFGSTVVTNAYNNFNKVVPYLLEEDFTGAPASNSNDTYAASGDNNTSTTGVSLSGTLSGWSASRYQVFANKYTRIGVRYQKVATGATTGRYCGRLDTSPLSKLKSGANASIQVVFDMGCYIPNKAYYMGSWFSTKYWDPSDNAVVTCQAGTHTNTSNPLAGQNQNDVAGEFTSVYTSGAMSDQTGDTGTFTENAFPHRSVSFVATGAGNTTRVCWWALTSADPSYSICNSHYYIYLDNIKISIDNSVQ